jgi:dCTP deaminase
MYLSDATIKTLVAEGHLGIDPFDPALVQPASVDCRLGPEIKAMADGAGIDPYQAGDIEWISTAIPTGRPYLLTKGAFVLGHTVETYRFPADILGGVNGKSSLGRLGLAVHTTAGWCDPGFSGQVTLELSNIGPRDILLWPGMLIAQMVFAFLDHPAKRPYGSDGLGSRYKGQMGATGSRFTARLSQSPRERAHVGAPDQS